MNSHKGTAESLVANINNTAIDSEKTHSSSLQNVQTSTLNERVKNDDNINNTNDTQHPSVATGYNVTKALPIINTQTQTPQSTISDRLSTDALVTGSRGTVINANTPPPCPCSDIVTSMNSRHCAFCGCIIPALDDLLSEQDTHEHEIQSLQHQLHEGQHQIELRAKDISQLQLTAKRIQDELSDKTNAFYALQNDMEQLNDKYVDEIDRVAEIQYSKDMVENELEDLSRRLFEEANGMVANEKREKYNLKLTRKHLENQLEETRDRLAAEQMQLQELRLKMEAMQDLENDNDKSNRNSNITYVNGNRIQLMNGGNSKRNSNGSIGTNSGMTELEGSDVRGMKDLAGLFPDHALDSHQKVDTDSWLGMDTMLLDEFIDFVKLRTSVPLKKLHSIPFMKYCQLEDVDPCLRFGISSRLSSRKMNDAIVMNTCFIEDTPYGFAEEQAKRPIDIPLKISAAKTMLWERFSSNSQTGVFTGCQACGRTNATSLPYRFRISYFDDWACIDRYCRDRLVAVCEFYVFIRNVRQGYYSTRTVLDLYQEAMRLRLQMFYARVGALPWTIRSLGIKGDKIGSATSPKFEIPEPPISESSPFPRRESSMHDNSKRSGSMDGNVTEAQIHNTSELSDDNRGGPADDTKHSDDSILDSTDTK